MRQTHENQTAFFSGKGSSILAGQSGIHKHRRWLGVHQQRCGVAAFCVNILGVVRVFLVLLMIHNKLHHSNAFERDLRAPLLASTLSKTRWRCSGARESCSLLSSRVNTCSKEIRVTRISTNAVSRATSPTRSFESSVKTYYRPSTQHYNRHELRDFRSHEDKDRIHLDWMVRNTAKILGEDAKPPGEMTPQLIKITRSLMQVWAQRAAAIKSSNAPHVVEKLLQRLLLEKRTIEEEGGYDDGNRCKKNRIEICIEDYNAVLEAWSHSTEQISVDRAEEILMKMEVEDDPKPNCRSYNAVIKALVKNGDRHSAVDRVEDLVLKMDATGNPETMPDRRSYNLLLYALSNSNRHDAAERATGHLERMIFRYRNTSPEERKLCNVKPDVNSFNQVIGAWARGKTSNYLIQMEKVFDLLLELASEFNIQLNSDTYNAVMGGWLKSNDKNALSRIQHLFLTMEEDCKRGNKSAQPDRVSINTLQTALNRFSAGKDNAKHSRLEVQYDIPHNSQSQNILMESIIKSGVHDAPEQALGILSEMEKSFENGQVDMIPDECSYSAVIKAHVTYKRKNLETKAEKLLSRMWNLHQNHGGNPPDVNVYNSLINAYASLKSYRGVTKAKQILDEMENGKKGLPKPNLITYNTVIKAMRNGNRAEGAVFAENILSRLERLGKDDPELLPDNYSYTSVITAYGRSSSPKKAEKALEIIERMTEAQKNGNKAVIVTTQTFNAALNSCAFVDGNMEEKARAFEIATKLDGLRAKSGQQADCVWYGTLLRACSTLIPPSEHRENLVDLFFHEAREKGCVGRLVLQQLKFAANRQQQIRLLKREFDEGDHVRLDELPEEWTCNSRDWGSSVTSCSRNPLRKNLLVRTN